MEVEMHSPSFRTLRSYTANPAKRPRSPGSPSPPDRPPKRPSLAVDNAIPSPLYPLSSHNHLSVNSAGSSRHPSEDWVQQTGGLTIDSPLPPDDEVSFHIAHEHREQDPMDENMTMEPDEEKDANLHNPGLPPSRTLHTQLPYTQTATESSWQYSLHQGLHQNSPSQLLSSVLTTQYHPHSLAMVLPKSALQPQELYLPAISIVPQVPCAQEVLSQSSTRPSTPMCRSPISMSISPTSSYATIASSVHRKQRFTMGPRSDCEKCRLGVKGHWMHLD